MIVFKNLRFKNFLSTGNKFTEIKLNETDTTLILGANGAGKSTMLDALTFVLFGKPYRKINKPQLINAHNERELLVEVEFSIGKKEYKIVRGMKPNIFEVYIDDKMLDQDSKAKDHQRYIEENILKLNYKSFTQVVVLGSSNFVPFMQLTAADRRHIIEDLLGIKIFSVMNELLKQRRSDTKDSLLQVDIADEIAKEKRKLSKSHIKELETSKKDRIDAVRAHIAEDMAAIERIEADRLELENKIELRYSHVKSLENNKSKKAKMNRFHDRIKANRKSAEKVIEFLQSNDVCPTCEQDIDESFKLKTTADKTAKIEEYSSAITDLTDKINEVSETISTQLSILEEIHRWEKAVASKNSAIKTHNRNINRYNKEIIKIEQQTDNTKEVEDRLEELNKEILAIRAQKEQLVIRKNRLEIIQLLLKDSGIKTRIVKKYLPTINKLVNKYLQAMDFYVKFDLDESFKETIQTRGKEDFSYASFSEGEKLRIDLSLLFTWREVAKLKNSANTNILILDEVFDSSLDNSGTDEFLKLIQSMDKGIHVWVISHKGDALVDKFSRTIRFKKVKNYSVMEEDG